MIIDLKYHITSLAAVFLALGIGIVVGSVMLGNDTIVMQQERLTDSLEGEMRLLRLDNQQLKKKINDLELSTERQGVFAKGILPDLLENRLTGMTVSIVDTANTGKADSLAKTLEMAGAEVRSITTVLRNPVVRGAGGQQKLMEYLGLRNNSAEASAAALAGQVGRGIFPGDNEIVMGLMEQAGLISRTTGKMVEPDEGPEASANAVGNEPVDAVVILGGTSRSNQQKPMIKQIDVSIIKYLQKNGLTVFGAEAAGAAVSYMSTYQRLGITTVDNIDTIPGQVALVLAMDGRPGNFGIKSTAKSLLPTRSGAEGDLNESGAAKRPGLNPGV